MLICKVVKPLVSTNRIPDFEHKHLQVVLDGSTQTFACGGDGVPDFFEFAHVTTADEANYRYIITTATNDILGILDARDGIFDFDDERNPLAEHSFVYVPYCTGDVYSGDRTAVYEDPDGIEPPLVYHHNGVRNTRAILAWLRQNLPRSGQQLVTGCSAGGSRRPGGAPASHSSGSRWCKTMSSSAKAATGRT